MSDSYSSNITQILTSFESFIKTLEDPCWMVSAKVEDIKTAFKLGSFIEKSVDHFKTQTSLDQFLSVLTKWMKEKHRTKVYSERVYAKACDELIIKFFTCSNISEVNLDIAVRVYTSIFPKKRFEEVITRILINAGNVEALSEYVKETFNDNDAKKLGYHFKLQNWDLQIQRGQMSNVKDEIKDMLASYNVETFLYMLIGVLSLTQVSSEEKTVQNIILNSILEKMSERSILTKQFWITMFKTIEISNICRVCNNFEEFLNGFLNFVVHIGSMMNKIGNIWKSDPNICFYPEIDYEEILSHLLELYKVNDSVKNTIVSRLTEAKEFTDTNVWEETMNVLMKL